MNGVLSNTLYVGRLTYNRQRVIKDPATGKRQARENPRSDWLTAEMPELRIIDADTWEGVQARRRAASTIHLTHQRRAKRLLSGLIRCGLCGGNFIVRTRDYVGCSRRINAGACSNKREVAMGEIEDRVIRALRQHLLAPEAVEFAVEAYRLERQRLAQEHAKTRNQCERQLSELKRRISHLVSAIETGEVPGPLMIRLSALEAERRLVERRMQLTRAAVVTLHPHAAARYRQKVAEIQDALSQGDAAGAEAVALVRELIGEIRVLPQGKGELEIVGDLAALLAQESTANAVTASVVAGAGFEPTTFRL